MWLDKKFLQSKIEELGAKAPRSGVTAPTGWYQEIELDGVKTHPGNPSSNIEIWKIVRGLIDESLAGKLFLDLGCNAGLYSMEAAVEGASVVGVDHRSCYIEQAEFIKTYYECLHGILDVRFKLVDLADKDINDLGYFDYAIALYVLRHIPQRRFSRFTEDFGSLIQKKLTELSTASDHIIIRSHQCVPDNSPEFHDKLLAPLGFTIKNRINIYNDEDLTAIRMHEPVSNSGTYTLYARI